MSRFEPVNKSFCLEQLCSANYQKLLRLAPDLRAIQNATLGVSPRQNHLFLKVIGRSTYTLTVELGHCWGYPESRQYLPVVVIRIYLDAKMAEVLSDSAPDVFAQCGRSKAIMDYKWRLNYFLQKWLEHCLKQDYLFQASNSLLNAAA